MFTSNMPIEVEVPKRPTEYFLAPTPSRYVVPLALLLYHPLKLLLNSYICKAFHGEIDGLIFQTVK